MRPILGPFPVTMPPYSDALLTHLFRLHGPMVRRRALSILGNAAEAEEVLQEVFIKAMSAIEGAREDDLTGWFYRMTTNHCLNRLRDQKRRRALIDAKVAPAMAHSARPNPDAKLILRWLLANADPRQAQAVTYRFVDGLQQAQIAELMGVTERTVRNLLSRFQTWADTQLADKGRS